MSPPQKSMIITSGPVNPSFKTTVADFNYRPCDTSVYLLCVGVVSDARDCVPASGGSE